MCRLSLCSLSHQYLLSQSEPDALEACVVSLRHQRASVPPRGDNHWVCFHPELSGSSQAVPPCLLSLLLLFFLLLQSSCYSFYSLLVPTGPPGLPFSFLPPWGAGAGNGGPGCGPPDPSSWFTRRPKRPGKKMPRCVNFDRWVTKEEYLFKFVFTKDKTNECIIKLNTNIFMMAITNS